MQFEKETVLPRSELTSLKWIILISGVIAVFAVLVVSIYLHIALEREAVQNWREQNLPLAKALAGRIDQKIEKAAATLRLVAGLPQFRQPLNPDNIEQAIGGVAESFEQEKRQILERLRKENADLSLLFLLTANGDHYLAQPFDAQRGVRKYNMSDRAYFRETLRTGSTVVSDSFVGADGRLIVVINTPIKNSRDEITAHLGGVFYLDHVAKLIQRIDIVAFDELFLLDRKGGLVGHSNQQWLIPDQREAFRKRPEMGELLAVSAPDDIVETSYRVIKDPDGGSVRHAFTVPLASGWRMVALRDRSSLLSSVQARSNAITATTALILLNLAGFGLAFVNSVGKRWRQAETALIAAKRQLENEVEVRTHELIASHEQIELLLASTGAGIFGIDLQGSCTFCNIACVETLGYPSDRDLLGKHLFDIIHHCHSDGTPYERDSSPILAAVHSEKKVYREHEVFCTADGECMPVEYRAYPMRLHDKVVGAVVTFNDISARINAQQAQADSDARFHSLFTRSNDAIFLLNPQTGHYLDANKAAEKLTGRSVDELITLTTSDVCPAGASERRNRVQEIEATCDMGEVIYLRPDGTARTAQLSVVPLADGLVFGIAHDITEQIASKQALMQREAHLRALSEAAFEAIFISEEGVCLGQNPAAEKLFGYSLAEVLGRSILEWVARQSRELVRQNILDGCTEPYEVLALRKDGSTFPAEIRGRSMPYQDRTVRVTALRDITDRRNAELRLQRTNTLLHAVIDQAPFAITLCEGSAQDWFLTLANQEAQRITGATEAQQHKIRFIDGELLNPTVRTWEMLHPDGTPIDVRDTPLVRAMVEQRVTRSKEMIIRRTDGVETYVLANASPIYGDDGSHIAGIFTYPDITENKRTEETIRTLSQAMEQSPVSVVITGLDGVIEYTNRGFERSSGYSSEEMCGQHTRLLGSGNTPAEVYKELWSTITSGRSWQGEFQNKRRDGSLFWEYAHISPIFDSQGRIRHYLAVKEDITLRKVQEEKILHQAHFDSLTGLPNRFLALDRLSQIIRTAHREHHQAAVLFLDLDDFKKVNDTLGHEVGDQVIEEAARRVKWAVREEDTVGRLGGDEFIVLLAHLHDKSDAMRVAEKILAAFRTVFRLGDREILLTSSIGISIYPDDGDTAKILLRNADTAMYYSKSIGRNVFNFYTDAMNQDVSRRVELEEQLYTALDNDEFYLHFQPIVNIYSQGIVGAEALLRWNNPRLGQVAPTEFIEIAERTGRIVQIGEYVLRQAVQQARHWHDQHHQTFRVAVNVSPVQFKDGNFLTMVKTILKEYQLPGKFLEIEVTENVLLSEKINSVEILNGLRDLGISLSMDDFGTGYSSLSYLRHYHFDTLKIDRSFVRDITSDPDDRELVVATISMARSLGLKVIAEGVENAEQLAILQAEKCDFAQGYYFSKPITAKALERFFMN